MHLASILSLCLFLALSVNAAANDKCLPSVTVCAEASKKMSHKKDCSQSNVDTFSDCFHKLSKDSQCKSYYARFVTDIGKVFAKECKYLFQTASSIKKTRDVNDVTSKCLAWVTPCAEASKKMSTNKDCSESNVQAFSDCHKKLYFDSQCKSYYGRFITDIGGVFAKECKHLFQTASSITSTRDESDVPSKCLPWVIPCAEASKKMSRNKDCSDSNVNTFSDCHEKLYDDSQCKRYYGRFITDIGKVFAKECKHLFTTGGAVGEKREIIDTSVYTSEQCQSRVTACEDVFYQIGNQSDCSKDQILEMNSCRSNLKSLPKCYNHYSYLDIVVQNAFKNNCNQFECQDVVDICKNTDTSLNVNKDCSIRNPIEKCTERLQKSPQCLDKFNFYITKLKDSYDAICKPYNCHNVIDVCEEVLYNLDVEKDCSKESLLKANECRFKIPLYAHCHKSYSYMIQDVEALIAKHCDSPSC